MLSQCRRKVQEQTWQSHAHALQVHPMQLHLHELLIAHVTHWDAMEPHALHIIRNVISGWLHNAMYLPQIKDKASTFTKQGYNCSKMQPLKSSLS